MESIWSFQDSLRVLLRWGQSSLWSRASFNLTAKLKSFWCFYNIMFHILHFLPTLTSKKWNIFSPMSTPGIVLPTAFLYFFPWLVSFLSYVEISIQTKGLLCTSLELPSCARSCSLVVSFHFPAQISERARLFWVPLPCTKAWKLFSGHKLRQL